LQNISVSNYDMNVNKICYKSYIGQMLCRIERINQGCQVAVATAPLLKSGRRKFLGAVKNSGP
jgi:hypothetical protein